MSTDRSHLADLVRINDALDWAPEGSSSFIGAVEILRTMMGARLAPCYLLDASGERLVLVADEEQRAQLGTSFATMPAREHVHAPWVNAEEWPVQALDHLDAFDEFPDDFKAWFGTSGVVASLHADGRHLGAVLLCFDGHRPLTDDERDFLAAAGRILGSALNRWQLTKRERELGALEERRRLSDELHVDLSQQVAAFGLRVALTRMDAADPHPERLLENLDGLDMMVEDLKRSLRHQMLGLRTDAEVTEGTFTEQIGGLVDQVRLASDLSVGFDTDGCDACIPVTIGAQLVRVAREALANVQLHAKATRVTVRLRSSTTRVRLEIEDDGIGFDPGAVLDSRLGLKIMGERIHQLDGGLRFQPGVRGGTLVIAEVPVRPMDLGAMPATVATR